MLVRLGVVMDQIDSKTLRSILGGVGVLVLGIGIGIWLYSTGKLGYVWLNPSGAVWVAFFIIVEILAALAFVLFILKSGYKADDSKDTSPVLGLIESTTLRHILLGAGVLVIGTFVWAGTFLLWKEQPELALPIVIIAGVIILL